jgi:hypothetical protein
MGRGFVEYDLPESAGHEWVLWSAFIDYHLADGAKLHVRQQPGGALPADDSSSPKTCRRSRRWRRRSPATGRATRICSGCGRLFPTARRWRIASPSCCVTSNGARGGGPRRAAWSAARSIRFPSRWPANSPTRRPVSASSWLAKVGRIRPLGSGTSPARVSDLSTATPAEVGRQPAGADAAPPVPCGAAGQQYSLRSQPERLPGLPGRRVGPAVRLRCVQGDRRGGLAGARVSRREGP